MFFILSKVLNFLINPLVWISLCLLGALFLRSNNWKRKSLITGLALFFFFSNSWISNMVMHFWEPTPIPVTQLDTSYDIGIVLSGYTAMGYDLPHDPALFYYGNNANRLSQAIELYQMGVVKQLLLAGGSGVAFGKKISESMVTKQYLIRLGIPDQDILVEPSSRNTHENALFTANLLKKEGRLTEKILLLTTASHMPRAKRCFDKVGLAVTAFPIDYISSAPSFTFNSLIPSIGAISVWQRIIKELVGTFVYWVRGYA